MFGWSTRWGFLIALGLVLAAWFGRDPIGNWRVTRHWTEARCRIEESSLGRSGLVTGHEVFWPRLRFELERDGRRYLGRRYHLTLGTSPRAERAAAIVARFPPGTEHPCWFNPADPSQLVLSRETPRGALAGLLLGLAIMVVALFKFIRLMTPMGLRLVRPEYLDKLEADEAERTSSRDR